MKTVAILLPIMMSILCFTGCSRQASNRGGEDMTSLNAEYAELIDKIGNTTSLIEDHRRCKDGKYFYPESYGGYYVEGKSLIVLVTDLGAVSEYQYLTDSYADTAFKKVEYSYNYLQRLIDEYKASDEHEETEYCSVDVKLNRAVVRVNDKQKLAQKQYDDNSPLIFKEADKNYAL